MIHKAYCFQRRETIEIGTKSELLELLEARRKRGASEQTLELLRNWHLSKINQH